MPTTVSPERHSVPHSSITPPGDSSAGLRDVVVIIPALNEEASLPLVLDALPPTGAVIVVDNGSEDRTAEVAAGRGAHVVREPIRGYGKACLAGLSTLQRLVSEGILPAPRIVAFVDADYSDHPDLLPLLVAPIHAGEADFVLGSRLLGERESGAMPPQSVYGNRLACWLMRILLGHRYTDLGLFRAIGYDSLKRIGMVDEGFGWTVEMQLKALQAGLSVLEIPVPYRRRIGTSKISGTISGTIRAGYRILWTIARYGVLQRSGRQPRQSPRDAEI